uniref:Uncharacterized protein n=1 Tax=uncultured bacterium pMCBF6 TaxID=429581 RepID=F2Q678_9BACT|nr:hypothetical protein orf 2 Tn5058 [uncultured bacterium pMCBF6]
MLCRRGRHGGQLHFQIGQRFAPAFDELTQHSKLRGSFIAVRRIQRPAQPRQCAEADARLEGGPHEAQSLQGGVIEQAVAAWCARHRAQQSAQQVVAHDMHAHPGIKGQPGHRVGVHRTPPFGRFTAMHIPFRRVQSARCESDAGVLDDMVCNRCRLNSWPKPKASWTLTIANPSNP